MRSTIAEYLMTKKPGSNILDQPYIHCFQVAPKDPVWDIWRSIRGPLYQLIASVLDDDCRCAALDMMEVVGQDPDLTDTILVILFPSVATAEHWPALELAITHLAQEKAEDHHYYEPIRVVFRHSDKPLEVFYHAKQFLDNAIGISYDPWWL